MSTRKKSTSAAAKLAEISIASPQVIAHRVTRMAMSGPVLSERDRKEFTNMVQEKQVAFAQSGGAVHEQAVAESAVAGGQGLAG